jgi:LCP family protein required for cell wall assembly
MPKNIKNHTAVVTPDATTVEGQTSHRSTLAFLILKTMVLSLSIVVVLFLITGAVLAGITFRAINQVATAANTTPQALTEVVRSGWQEPITQDQGKKNILILGVDAVANRQGDPLLTDTILLASLDIKTGETSLLSLPRDVWHPEYLTKINALYFYGQDRYPDHPEQFTQEVISSMTGVPIHHTIVLTLDQVATIIDTLGGVEVTVETGFIDTQFPRADVDIKTITDPALLYETIEFKPGIQVMDGQTALKYIRSRHSSGEQGTDQARGMRQQQVITALITTLLDKEVLTNPALIGKLLAFYQGTFADKIPLTQLVAVGRSLFENRTQLSITIHRENISVRTLENPGVLYHPPLTQTQNQWSYSIEDETAFKEEVWQKLRIKK